MLFGALLRPSAMALLQSSADVLGKNGAWKHPPAAGNALIGAFGITLVLAVFTYIFRRPVILFFGATEEILPLHRAIHPGHSGRDPLSFCQDVFKRDSQSRGAGQSLHGFYDHRCCAHTILDPVLIFGFKMGITGAALATVISQVVAVTLVVYYFAVGRSSLPFSISSFTVRLPVMSDIIRSRVRHVRKTVRYFHDVNACQQPAGFYVRILVIAAYGMIIRLMIFIMMPMFGLVHGFQPIAGYNYGARNFQRVRSVLATSVLMATLFASLCWLFIMMVPTQILSVFSLDQELLAIASPALKM